MRNEMWLEWMLRPIERVKRKPLRAVEKRPDEPSYKEIWYQFILTTFSCNLLIIFDLAFLYHHFVFFLTIVVFG